MAKGVFGCVHKIVKNSFCGKKIGGKTVVFCSVWFGRCMFGQFIAKQKDEK